MDASSWDIVLTDTVHCSFFGIDQSSFLIQTWILPNPRRTNHQTSSYTAAASPSSSSLGSDTSWHGGFDCAALFLLSLNAFSARSFCASGSPFALSGSDGLPLFRCVVMDGQAGRLDAHFCTV